MPIILFHMNIPLLTADLPGTAGRIKVELDDFEVEEVPAYEPSGIGDHLFLWVEKRDVGAEYFAKLLGRKLGVPPNEVGTAGMKDRRAVTRQWVSVPKTVEPRLAEIDGDGLTLLRVSRHGNKLRPGHLRGNRFRVLVREADAAKAEPILARLRESGLPNYYGEQRFGREGETVNLGMAMLKRERTPRVNPFLRKLALSAAQSQLFNDWLARRLTDGLLRTVLAGDVLAKWPVGGMFVSTDAAADQPRLAAREVVPAGPMFGRKMFASAAVAAEREAAVLGDAGLAVEAFAGFGKLVEGTRRHALVYVDELTATVEPDGLRLAFALPAGSYAPVRLREVIKPTVADAP
ncbi:MAG: tRNA pseudouridine(13) synthase TruD [Gemmataceae bacterium]